MDIGGSLPDSVANYLPMIIQKDYAQFLLTIGKETPLFSDLEYS